METARDCGFSLMADFDSLCYGLEKRNYSRTQGR